MRRSIKKPAEAGCFESYSNHIVPDFMMGDNGHFTKYSPQSGYTPMIFRGGKGSTFEGGVRVDAFVRWPGMIEADSVVGDMVHVTDLFTTFMDLA